MRFEADKKIRKIGEKTGIMTMYLIFTTLLYFILKLLERLPENWGYFHIVLLTLFIILLGTLIKMLLN